MTMVGAAMGPFTIPIPALFLTQEKKIQGCILGSCNSHRDVPKFLSLWRKGAPLRQRERNLGTSR